MHRAADCSAQWDAYGLTCTNAEVFGNTGRQAHDYHYMQSRLQDVIAVTVQSDS